MTKLTVKKEKKTVRIISDGHSGFAPAGEDLVCAGISALVLMLAGFAAAGNGELVAMRSGYFEMTMPANKHTELITDALKVTAETMKIRYGKYVQFNFQGV
jgi:uncharacterized protein YsxB (DUF464 family)